jgi:hemoglobin-like flavoprotein
MIFIYHVNAIFFMTTKQIELVTSSWKLVAAIDPVIVGTMFYNRLAELSPDTRPLFGVTIAEQSTKIIPMLGYIISKLSSLDDIIDEVAKLARRHVHYGVKEDHYYKGGDALLWTLERGLGENWNEELKEAWTVCYGILSSAMIDAAGYLQQDAA